MLEKSTGLTLPLRRPQWKALSAAPDYKLDSLAPMREPQRPTRTKKGVDSRAVGWGQAEGRLALFAAGVNEGWSIDFDRQHEKGI